MFLHRDFFPTLPLRLMGPKGPVDPPFFHSEAPPGWWNSSSEIIHEAADSIAVILVELGNASNPLMTPLVGFCAFSAAIANSYVEAFPYMNLGKSTNAGARAEACIAYLTEFAKIWKIGDDWVKLKEPFQYE